jgi:hypothetical protein
VSALPQPLETVRVNVSAADVTPGLTRTRIGVPRRICPYHGPVALRATHRPPVLSTVIRHDDGPTVEKASERPALISMPLRTSTYPVAVVHCQVCGRLARFAASATSTTTSNGTANRHPPPNLIEQNLWMIDGR